MAYFKANYPRQLVSLLNSVISDEKKTNDYLHIAHNMNLYHLQLINHI